MSRQQYAGNFIETASGGLFVDALRAEKASGTPASLPLMPSHVPFGSTEPAEGESPALGKLRELLRTDREAREQAQVQVNACHAWLRNELADAARREGGKTAVMVEVDAAFVGQYLSLGLNVGATYSFDQFLYDSIHNAQVQYLLLGLFNQAAEKGRFASDLRGARFHLKIEIFKGVKKFFIIFTGDARLRSVVIGSRYRIGRDNKVVPLTLGAGTWGEAIQHGVGDAGKMFRPNTWTGRFFYLALGVETYNWWHQGDHEAADLIARYINTTLVTGTSLIVTPLLVTALLKISGEVLVKWAGAEAVAGGAVLASAGSLVLIFGGAAVVIGVGLLINFAFDSLGVKEYIREYLDEVAEYYRKQAEKEFEWGYYAIPVAP